MKIRKKMLACLLAAAVAATSALPAYAAGVNSPSQAPTTPAGNHTVEMPGNEDANVTVKPNGEVTVNSVQSNKATVTIPSTVVVNGVECKVTTIGANTFKDCKKMKEVKIPSSVKTIGKNVFKGASKLKKAVINGAATFKSGALNGVKNLTLKATGKATFNANSFKGASVKKLTVGKKATFKKNALKGSNMKKIEVTGKLTKKQKKAYVKALVKAGAGNKVKVTLGGKTLTMKAAKKLYKL